MRGSVLPLFPRRPPKSHAHHHRRLFAIFFFQTEKAISERAGSVLDDPDQLAALAVAVASSAEPLETLETLCQSVLDGVDVGAALKALLDKGKKDIKRYA